MLFFIVIAQSFAVIGGQHDDGAIVDSQPLEVIEKRAHDLIRSGDLTVIPILIPTGEWFRWGVGNVGLVEVKKKEEWLVSVL